MIPRVGWIKLADLTPLNLRRLKSDPLNNGKVDGSALSHQSVANCCRALKKALSDAVKRGLLSNNPMTFVNAPRVSAVSRPTWDAPTTKRGQRSIALDASTVEELRSHRRRQLEDRLRAGPAWSETGFVFCGLDGLPLHPDPRVV